MSEDKAVVLPLPLRERLLASIRQRHPRKSFGYFISDKDPSTPTDFILFEDNIRNSDTWKTKFESYGQYFIEHDDAGFVATPEESWRVQNEIWKRDMVEVGIFHSHLRHPANFSGIDFDLHTERFDNLWHMIISMRNPTFPQLRAFSVTHEGVRELPVLTPPSINQKELSEKQAPPDEYTCDRAITQARTLLELDKFGRPKYNNYKALFIAIDSLLQTRQNEAITELLTEGFLRGCTHRFLEYIASGMRLLPGGRFQMGTDYTNARHFCGETPRHDINLSPFYIGHMPITNELFGLFDQRWLDVPHHDLQKPATGVTWFDATVFALWMGCRLPTEAEWEFACGGGSEGEWCCEEEMLSQYAWYSENSQGTTHTVGTRAANQFHLYDLHGNVWEWCQDNYHQDYYASSPIIDPVNIPPSSDRKGAYTFDKVCRGGSIHALSEMCRTRYRFHEPADFLAEDLGFRLARNPASEIFA